ncbi:MAG: hypothetical protein IPJ82_04325 [Lewinellaceae bacterium]|nr:hypothetical protein [Lewinellaceae bacterium]
MCSIYPFQVSGLTKNDLNGSQTVLYEKSELGTFTESIWIVEMESFTQQIYDRYLEIRVPGNDTIRSYKAKFVEADPSNNMAWYGETAIASNHWGRGYASFVYQDGELLGYFSFEADNYSLRSIGGGPGNYTYAWQTAINGYTYSPVLSTTDVLTLDLSGKQPGDAVFIRLTVTSALQQVAYAYFSVEIIPDDDDCLYRSQEAVANGFSFQATPNPADDNLAVLLKSDEQIPLTVELFGCFGQFFIKRCKRWRQM